MWPFPTHTTVAEVKACIDYTKYKTDNYPMAREILYHEEPSVSPKIM